MLQWPSQHAGGLPEKADIKLCSPAFHAAASTVQSCSYIAVTLSCPSTPHYTAPFNSIVTCSLKLEQGLHMHSEAKIRGSVEA